MDNPSVTTERSAYPHPDDFKVMRPEYEESEDDGSWTADINLAPFKVTGVSSTKAGARRAALYEACKVYRSYHPNYKIKSPYPESFKDQTGTQWEQVNPMMRRTVGDYKFEDEEGEDYADIETMLLWDIRVHVERAEGGEEE